jgi:hypothetical protein
LLLLQLLHFVSHPFGGDATVAHQDTTLRGRMRPGAAALVVSSFIAILSVVPLGHAAMPELECHADEQTRIDPITLDADHSDVSDIYLIRGGQLFITTPGEAEYLYNKVVEVEPGRFVSVTADPGRKLVVVHTHELDIRVTRFFCR